MLVAQIVVGDVFSSLFMMPVLSFKLRSDAETVGRAWEVRAALVIGTRFGRRMTDDKVGLTMFSNSLSNDD